MQGYVDTRESIPTRSRLSLAPTISSCDHHIGVDQGGHPIPAPLAEGIVPELVHIVDAITDIGTSFHMP